MKLDLTQCQVKKETLKLLKNFKYDSKEPMWSVLDRLAKSKEELMGDIQTLRQSSEHNMKAFLEAQKKLSKYENGITGYLRKT